MKRNNGIISYNVNSSIWTNIKESYDIFLDNTNWITGNGSKGMCLA